ncbi:hypothetical protein QR680_001682 [Steinernema hermaphroditum]|uniref:Uncharacterized protein n=1 Tax=Steinernema hermaphroditum TaxID=289476 RepID=A0AA39LGL6_9BILA|nr:hypothetical protein QR680_001682 [Steinernema hermaphroditum]
MSSSSGGTKATEKSRKSRIVDAVLFGSASAALSSVMLQPLDRLKTIVQQDAKSSSLRANVTELMAKHGIVDLWRGISPSLVRIIPGVAVYFGCMEAGKTWFDVEKSNTAYFGLGFFSRAAATVALLPATIVKTRFEINSENDDDPNRDRFDCVCKMENVNESVDLDVHLFWYDLDYGNVS